MASSRRLTRGLAAALCFAVAGGTGMALVRYLGAREDLQAARAALQETVEGAAREAGEGAQWPALGGRFDRMAVVLVGTVDAFGIARGAQVAYAKGALGERELADAATAFEAEGGHAQVVLAPGIERSFIARAALRSAVGAYSGMLEVRQPYDAPAPRVPGWLFALCALGALLAGATLPGSRLGQAGAAGLAAGALLAPGGWGFAAATGAGAALCGGLAGPGLAEVLRGLRQKPTAYLYVLPAMAALLGLVFVPFVMGVVLAFFDASGEPVGLANFVEILAPEETSYTAFWRTFGVTALWTVANVALHLTIGLSLALVLNRADLKGKGVYRVLLIVPWAVPNYITALVWKWMFNAQYGAFNALLALFDVDPVNWLQGSFGAAFLANLATNTWLGFPFMMVVTLGALQSIPAELYEAATLDGASRWQRFRHVTLPLLKPALVPAVILGSIWTFNMFNVIYLVSGGGPDHQTEILVTEAYYHFKVLKRYGLAAAYALCIFGILAVYGWLTNRVTRATEGAFE